MKKILIITAIILFSGITTRVFAQSQNADAVLHYNQGIDDYKSGLYDQAIEEFRTAAKLDPNYIDAYYNLGAVLEYMQQYDAALTVFKQIIVRKPDDYDSVYKAAWISYKLGQIDRAKTYLTLIPPTWSRAKEVQELAAKINFAMPKPQPKPQPKPVVKTTPAATTAVTTKPVTTATPKAVTAKTPATTPAAANVGQKTQSKIPQTSGMYSNLPSPTGITSDKNGNLYVAEFTTNSIIKITPDNKKIVFLKDAKIGGPIGIALDKAGNMYIANYNKNNVLKVTPLGEYSVLISNLQKPYGIYIDGSILFVSCQGTNTVLRYKLKP